MAEPLLSRLARTIRGPRCAVCGRRGPSNQTEGVLPARLVEEWQLDPTWVGHMDRREGIRCSHCGAPLRVQQLAEVLVEECLARRNIGVSSLAALARDPRARDLRVAEINRIGGLHEVLADLPGLCYSEYESQQPGVPSEDLLDLSYPDDHFDLVLTSDTLEHVPDFERALAEIHRVLRPDGAHVFTVPVVWDRAETVVRAELRGGEVHHLQPASYHGISEPPPPTCLVFQEFGADIEARIKATGCGLRVARDGENPALAVLVTWPGRS